MRKLKSRGWHTQARQGTTWDFKNPGYITLMSNSGHQRKDQTHLPYSRPLSVILTTNPGLEAPSPNLETSASSSRAITTLCGLVIILSSTSSWAEVGQSLFVGASLTKDDSRGWGAYKSRGQMRNWASWKWEQGEVKALGQPQFQQLEMGRGCGLILACE